MGTSDFAAKMKAAGMVVDSVKHGNTLDIIITSSNEKAEEVIKDLVRKALKKGEKVIRGDTEQWVHNEVIHDPTKPGSEGYIWDKSGNRCKHNRVLYTRVAGGDVTSEITGTSYREWG